MGYIILLLMGYGVWKFFCFIYSTDCDSTADDEDETENESREFHEMCWSLKDVDDDFDIYK